MIAGHECENGKRIHYITIFTQGANQSESMQ